MLLLLTIVYLPTLISIFFPYFILLYYLFIIVPFFFGYFCHFLSTTRIIFLVIVNIRQIYPKLYILLYLCLNITLKNIVMQLRLFILLRVYFWKLCWHFGFNLVVKLGWFILQLLLKWNVRLSERLHYTFSMFLIDFCGTIIANNYVGIFYSTIFLSLYAFILHFRPEFNVIFYAWV